MRESVGIVGRPDRERVDVEAAPREQARDAGEHAGLVLDQDREDVLAAGPQADGRLELLEAQDFLRAGFTHGDQPTISRAAAPGAIIGYVFSSRVTFTSTTTGPGVASAAFRSSTSVVLSVSNTPVAP